MTLKTDLYTHQVKAVEKLRRIKVGALYMEMGTGKTRTALELIKERYNAGKVDHVIWLCPCSVKKTIAKELQKHIDGDTSIFTICGIETLSSSVRTNIKLLKLVKGSRVYLVVDESNLIKNHKAKRTENITELSKLCQYKLILNGTPVSKNETDLFAQWYVLDWRILGYQSFWSFSANHIEWDERIRGKVRRCLNVDYLVRKIAPYTYQVRKEECMDLPRKSYKVVYYNLTLDQLDHYQDVAERLMFDLDELLPHTIYRLFAGLQNVISGYRVIVDKHLKRTPYFKNPFSNPRIQALLDVIDDLSGKVIVFCKYTDEILTITNILNDRYGQNSAVTFYGDVNQKERQGNLEKFAKDARFLIANKGCAGYGLNLQFCNYIIYYNNDWDYATRAQSEDRVHRIGQDKNVHIIDICAEHTLDERILDCLHRKEGLVETFKYQIDKQKDRKEFLSNWILTKKDVIDSG